MEIIDVVLYFILIIILISFIGVLSWLIYDYYNYRDEQNTINTKISNKFKDNLEKDKELEENIKNLHINNSNFLNATSNNIISYTREELLKNKETIDNYNSQTSNYIYLLNSNISTSNLIYNNLINSTSNVLSDNLKNNSKIISNNLNRYFTFSDITNDANNGIYNYIVNTVTTNQAAPTLNLIKETTAVSGLKINSSVEDNKYLKVCNKTGTNCYNLFVDTDNSLVAQYGTEVNTKKKIAINSSFVPAVATAVVSTTGTITAINITNPGNGYFTTPNIIITRVPTTTLPTTAPVNAVATAAIDTTGKVTGITIVNAGTGYTVAPTINIIS
jgi:hypothetical protein